MSKNLSAIEEEFIEEPTEILEKKTIITIAIMSHGQDMPKVPFLNENVRILSYAGRSGSIGLAQPTTLEHINKEFEKYFLEYHRKIPTKGKKKYMQQLYTDFPNANKCQKIPDFKFEEDGRATPVSTFNFLKIKGDNKNYQLIHKDLQKLKKKISGFMNKNNNYEDFIKQIIASFHQLN